MTSTRRLITLFLITTANAADDAAITPQHDCGGLRGDGSCAATSTSVCKGVQNFASAAGRVRRCSKIEGDLLIDHVELASLPFLTEVTGSIYIGSQPQYDGGNVHTLRRLAHCSCCRRSARATVASPPTARRPPLPVVAGCRAALARPRRAPRSRCPRRVRRPAPPASPALRSPSGATP